jgi:parallel beta-helix repeat protein
MYMYLHMQLDGMNKRYIWVIVALILMQSTIVFNGNNICNADSVLPKYYVDDDFNSTTPGWQNDHFDRIQDAIDSASAGERIIVYEGVYDETIYINKSIDIFGEDRDITIIDGSNTGSVITISATGVDVSTFTIRNSGSDRLDSGVFLTTSSGSSKIVDNIITNCVLGIYVNQSDNNVLAQNQIYDTSNGTFLISSNQNSIEYNDFYENDYNGIFLNETCSNNEIKFNQIYSNQIHGIYLNDQCSDNNIHNNTVYENENTGIRIEDNSSNIDIIDNIIKLNGHYGVMIVGSSNTIQNNLIMSNGMHGVFLFADDNTTVISNNITSNTYDGIRLQNSTDDLIKSNLITNNERYGVFVNYYSILNFLYNNYFSGNELNAKDISTSTSENAWYIQNTSGSNIIHGPVIAGNFWDDYEGIDENRDGIGETAYVISGGDKTDEHPLMYRRPVAMTGGPYNGCVLEEITFDGSASYEFNESLNLSYTWIFEDGATKTGKTITHAFSSVGTFSVQLTVENELGGTDTDTTTVTVIPDNKPPSIAIKAREFVTTDTSSIFTIKAEIIDNVAVNSVSLSYWFGTDENKSIASMNKKSSNIYEKTLIFNEPASSFHCIVNAVDVNGNENTSENPYAVFSIKTTVNVSEKLHFDGSDSFDLDGSITSYEWDFGDNIIRTGATANYAYTADGIYHCVLTVTDDEGNQGSLGKTITVLPPIPVKPSNQTLDLINSNGEFDITLSEPFVCYDTNGDGDVDMFIDPNSKLTVVAPPIKIDNEVCFLLSVNDPLIPEILWKTTSDRVQWITHVKPTISSNDVDINYETSEATLSFSVEKTGWIIIDIDDTLYPDAQIKDVKDKSNNNILSSDRYWRTNNKIFILDDPSLSYQIIFKDIFPEIVASFNPSDSGVISEESPTITISFNVPVSIEYAFFDQYNIKKELTKLDDQTYQYTPPGYWVNGTYVLEIATNAKYGNKQGISSATYFYFQYEQPPQPSFLEKYGLWLFFILIIGAGGAIYAICRYKGLKFNSYIYIKNRPIIPFIKPVILGPMSVSIDNSNVKKAEFYVDGALKKTISSAPFSWQWNESAFLNHKVEAKIIDSQGKNLSSGEMSVFIINPFKFDGSIIEQQNK